MERYQLDKWGLYAFPIYNGSFTICSNDSPNNPFISNHTHTSFAISPAIADIMKRSKTKDFHSMMAPFIADQNAVIIPQRTEDQPLYSFRKQTSINSNAIEGMIIYEFSRLDIADAGNSLEFCNKYGLPFLNPFLNKYALPQESANILSANIREYCFISANLRQVTVRFYAYTNSVILTLCPCFYQQYKTRSSQ